MIRSATFFVLPVLCFLSLMICAPGKAHAYKENPSLLQGIWSSPDCTKADSLWIISKYFFIRSSADGHHIDAAQHWVSASDEGEMLYALRSTGGMTVMMNRTNDGLMKVVDTVMPEKKTLGQVWASVQDKPFSEYSHCAKLFDSNPSIGQAEVNTVFLMDMAADECKGVVASEFSAAKTCHQSLYALADSDQNGSLNRVELVQLYQQTRFMRDGMAACPPSASTVAPGAASGASDADHFANRILRANGQKDIRFNDIPALMRTEKDQPHWIDFLNGLRSVHGLLGFVPPPSTDAASCAAAPFHADKNGAFPSKDPVQNSVEIQWHGPRTTVED